LKQRRKVMCVSILPVTIPPGQVQPFVPGGGDLFRPVLSRGREAEQIKKIASCKWFIKRTHGDAPLAGRT